MRPSRASSSFLPVLALVTAIAAAVAAPAPGCTIDNFAIIGGLDRFGHTTIGQEVSFRILFALPVDSSSRVLRNTQIGSVSMDYGDGTAEDTGSQTWDPPGLWGQGNKTFTHTYSKLGAFTVSVKGGRAQPCATKPGLVSRIPVDVVATYQKVGTDRANPMDSHALIPGKIERAGMVRTVPHT